jgi:hypothetical protein
MPPARRDLAALLCLCLEPQAQSLRRQSPTLKSGLFRFEDRHQPTGSRQVPFHLTPPQRAPR